MTPKAQRGRWSSLGEALDVLVTSGRMRIAELGATPGVLVFMVIQPAALLVIVLSASESPTPATAANVVFGVVLTAFWTATVRGTASVLARDRAQGVLARTVTGVKDPRIIVVGKGLGAGSAGLMAIGLTTLIVLLALRQPIALASPGWILIGLVAVLVSGTAAGLLLASLFVLTRHAAAVSSALIYLVYLLGGMLIPPEVLPGPLGWIPQGVSLHWLQVFLAGAAEGRVLPTALAAALGLSAAYALAGIVLFERMVNRARREATLELA